MTKEAIVLAGGLGTRLRSVVHDIPKCMAIVDGRPFLEFLLDYLSKHKINHCIMSVGYKHEHIIAHFGSNFNGIKIDYAVEKEPLGTGGAVRFAMDSLQGDYTFILNGDTYFGVQLGEMESLFHKYQANICMALKLVQNAGRYGSVSLDENSRIIGFREKNPIIRQGLINGGIYLLHKQVLLNSNLPDKFSLEKDFFEKSVASSKMIGYTSYTDFIDIGIPEDYEKAQYFFNQHH